MKGHDYIRSGSTTGGSVRSPRLNGQPAFAALPGHPVPVLFCLAILTCLFLIAPATAQGFVNSDCSCSLPGFTAKNQLIGSNQLSCLWTKQVGSTQQMMALTAGLEQNSKATLLTKMQAINNNNRNMVNEWKTVSFYTITEESYSDTGSVFIRKETRGGTSGERTTYYGVWAFIYRDTYGMMLGGEGFTTEQDLKGSIAQLGSCMKKAADAHAARQAGTSGPAPAGAAQAVPAGAGTAPEGEEEDSIDDILSDMGDEINEDLPLPVNWTGVPEAMGNSVTPAAAGAIGALVGGIAGSLIVLVSGIPWPAGSTGGGGSEPPGGQPVPEPGMPVQETTANAVGASSETGTSSAAGMSADGVGMGGPEDNPHTEYGGGDGPGGCPWP